MAAAAQDQFNAFRADVTKKLHQPNKFTEVLAKIEAKTGVDRFFLVAGVAGIFAIYMVFGFFAELVCNAVGFLYPAYMSIKAIETHDKRDDTQWLTYWVVFAVFTCVEFCSDAILSWFPLYWLIKCAILVYLHGFYGAEKLYQKFIRPYVLKHESFIDKQLGQAEQAFDTVKGGVEDVLKRE